ncbi:MAG: hypothetical protein ACRENE_09100 [Polyangiaceae bacterium]
MSLRLKVPRVLGTVRAELIAPSVLRVEGVLSQDDVRRDLAEVLVQAHDHVVASKLPTLTVDVRALSYANSSAIRVFIDMASRAQRAGYRLIVEIDGSITWHSLNFAVLQSLAPQSVELRDVRRAAGSP